MCHVDNSECVLIWSKGTDAVLHVLPSSSSSSDWCRVPRSLRTCKRAESLLRSGCGSAPAQPQLLCVQRQTAVQTKAGRQTQAGQSRELNLTLVDFYICVCVSLGKQPKKKTMKKWNLDKKRDFDALALRKR